MTRQLSISAGTFTPIKASENNTGKITVGELRSVGGFPTTDLLIQKGFGGASVQIASGTQYVFERSVGRRVYNLNDLAGSVSPVVGTTTITVDEESAP